MKKDIIVYVCDDDINFGNSIKQKLDNMILPNNKLEVSLFTDASSLIEKSSSNCADIAILDIDMPQIDGFQAAEELKKINKNVMIVFISSHDEKIFQSYSFRPIGLIRKDQFGNFEEYFTEAINKFNNNNIDNMVTFSCGNKNFQFNTLNILYIESYKNDIEIHFVNGSRKKIRYTISKAESELKKHNIVFIQRGLLINLRYVEKIHRNEAFLHNGTKFNVCRSKAEYIRKLYQDYARSVIQ